MELLLRIIHGCKQALERERERDFNRKINFMREKRGTRGHKHDKTIFAAAASLEHELWILNILILSEKVNNGMVLDKRMTFHFLGEAIDSNLLKWPLLL